jgi:hypothetical protein
MVIPLLAPTSKEGEAGTLTLFPLPSKLKAFPTSPVPKAAPEKTPLLPLTESSALLSPRHQLTRPDGGDAQELCAAMLRGSAVSSKAAHAEMALVALPRLIVAFMVHLSVTLNIALRLFDSKESLSIQKGKKPPFFRNPFDNRRFCISGEQVSAVAWFSQLNPATT